MQIEMGKPSLAMLTVFPLLLRDNTTQVTHFLHSVQFLIYSYNTGGSIYYALIAKETSINVHDLSVELSPKNEMYL